MLRKTKTEEKTLKEPESKEPELRHYSIILHYIWIILWMIVVAVLILFGVPWVIEWIYSVFKKWWSGNGTQLGILPDFFGGTIGIITGFFFEWQFFQKLRLLQKYKTLLVCLHNELHIIKNILLSNPINEKISFVAYEDIISSSENNSIFYNLPTYFPSLINILVGFHKYSRPFEKKGDIYKFLLIIYGDIKDYNRKLENRSYDQVEIEEKKKKTIKDIDSFISNTKFFGE